MMLVMVAVFFGLQFYNAKKTPKPATPAVAQTDAVQSGGPGASAGTGTASATTAGASTGAGTPTAPVVKAEAEATTVVENELYRIEFSNRGAQVASWKLKKFNGADNKPLELVHQQAAQQLGYPLSLYTYDAGLTKTLQQAMYVPSATGALAAPATLTFTYSDGAIQARKTFSFDETYVLKADVEVTRNGAPIRALVSWPGGFGDEDTTTAYNSAQLDVMRDEKVDHLAPKKVSGGDTLNGPVQSAGVTDQDLGAIFLPAHHATAT